MLSLVQKNSARYAVQAVARTRRTQLAVLSQGVCCYAFVVAFLTVPFQPEQHLRRQTLRMFQVVVSGTYLSGYGYVLTSSTAQLY